VAVTFPDIATLLATQAGEFGSSTAIDAPGAGPLAYAQLHERALQVAGGIAAVGHGGERGRPRIGIVLPNGRDMALALLGATVAGEAAPFNPGCTPSEFDAYFRATRIDALIVRDTYSGHAVGIAEKLGIRLLRFGDGGRIAGHSGGVFVPPKPDDIALVLMTSGSTGRPKIVPLTHRNVCTSAAEVASSMGLTPRDRCLAMWEQYHIGGLVDLLLAPLASGGSIIATAGFDAAKFYELLHAEKPTWYQGVPTALTELVFHAARNPVSPKPSSLRLIRSVAAALAPALLDEVEALFGVPVIQTLGMTEASPLITSTEMPPAVRKRGSVGRSTGTRIRIVGPGGGSLAEGETGEVAIRGDNVFAGYEGDDEANRSQFRDGWFHTGDMGYLDAEGYLFLTGRIKQMINRGGEKISPQEVDDALLEHPAVAEAASFAVKHRTLGEDIAAAVVLRQPLAVEELRAFLATRVAPFKVPQRIAVLDRLPRNPVGKIDRLALAESVDRGEKVHVQPRDEIELFLARLWAKELNVDAVGIHDDFAALGGDSLSSMRILVAIEGALDMALPDEVLANFSTVAEIAGQLRLLGAGLHTDRDAGEGMSAAGEAGVGGILDRVEVGTVGLDDPEIVARRLEACGTADQFRILADAMTLYCTPAELTDLLDRTAGVRIGRNATPRPSFLKSLAMRALDRRWRGRVRRDIAAGSDAGSWKRFHPAPTAIHYHGADPAPGRTLIVGFTGNYMRLMMPTYRLLANLDPQRHGLLLLRDTGRAFFMRGLEGLGDDLDGIAAHVEEMARRDGYARTVALGTSGGGMAALCVAARAGWPVAVAVAAASPARHADIADQVRAAAQVHRPETTRLVLSFSGRNTRDADGANQLKALLPLAEMAPDARFDSHNLLDKLYHAGELKGWLGRWLD